MDWPKYFDAIRDMPPHPIFAELDKYLPSEGRALELGCGVGTGVLHLVQRGLRVVAVDEQTEPLEILRARLNSAGVADRVEIKQQPFQTFDLGDGGYDVVVAGFSIFFLQPNEFHAFWPRVERCLKPSGLFAGQLLGVNDDWNDGTSTPMTRAEVEELLSGFEILYFEEAERDGKTVWGEPKHWHIFHVVARKAGGAGGERN